MGTLILTLTVMSLAVVIGAIARAIVERFQFRREHNPFRRHCKDCGAEHVLMQASWNPQLHWWECQDKGCPKCRRFSRDDILPGW